MKKLFILLAGLAFTAGFGQDYTITHSQDLETNEFVVGCAAQDGSYTGFNSYSRSFVLSDFDINEDFTITEVTFGLAQLTGDLPFTLVFSTSNGAYPSGSLTFIGAETFDLSVADNETIINHTLETPIVIPAGAELVVAVEADGEPTLINWRPGGNLGGETAPSYLVAPACGANDPITFESTGFPGHLIMAVTGTTTMGTVDLNSNQLSIYPNPVSDILNINMANGLEIQKIEILNLAGQNVLSSKSANSVNVSALPAGVYVVKVLDNKGKTHVSKVVVK